MSLGPYPEVSLVEARAKQSPPRKAGRRQGRPARRERAARQPPPRRNPTFGQAPTPTSQLHEAPRATPSTPSSGA